MIVDYSLYNQDYTHFCVIVFVISSYRNDLIVKEEYFFK